MNISFQEARKKLIEALATSGAWDKDVETMADVLLEYDLHKNTFSAFSGVDDHRDQLRDSVGKTHKVVVDKPSMKLLDAQGKSAILMGADVVTLVSGMAKQNGIGLVGVYNATYHAGMEAYVRRIAANDLIGIVSANGGPAGVVPFGGTKALFGTNPLGYAIPSDGMPIVFDGATSKYPYGSIRIAKSLKKLLPEHSYFDADGKLTTYNGSRNLDSMVRSKNYGSNNTSTTPASL